MESCYNPSNSLTILEVMENELEKTFFESIKQYNFFISDLECLECLEVNN